MLKDLTGSQCLDIPVYVKQGLAVSSPYSLTCGIFNFVRKVGSGFEIEEVNGISAATYEICSISQNLIITAHR